MQLPDFLDYYLKNFKKFSGFSDYRHNSESLLKRNINTCLKKSPQWRFFDFTPFLNFAPIASIASQDNLKSQISANNNEPVATFVDYEFEPKFSTFGPHARPCLERTCNSSTDYFYLLNNLSFKELYFFELNQEKNLIINFINHKKNFNAVKISIIIPEKIDAKIEINYLNNEFINSMSNISIDFILKKDAKLTLINHNKERANEITINNYYFELAQNSELKITNLMKNGLIKRSFFDCNLIGANAKVTIKSLTEGLNSDNIYNFTLIKHFAASTKSEQIHKAILFDQARFDFWGDVEINENTKDAKAITQNKNLLMSPNAVIYTRPELKINHDEIKCSHGATIGKIDENALFYLTTRGLSLKNAKDLLITAFKNEITESVN
ncbi:MAG: SufD family Fe-S cluster assembly protein [Candidatus Margulisiibacteriota bacterium]|jgi:hypothetical protein